MNKLNCILLVDDDDTTNFYNEFLIKKMGVAENIRVTKNGLEAIDYLKQVNGESDEFLKPDLIFLDINMPLMNGFQFLEAYEALAPENKGEMLIVMLTSSSHPQDVEMAKGRDAVKDYVTKPLMEDTIAQIITTHFG